MPAAASLRSADMNWRLIKDYLAEGLIQFRRFDLRWSYLVTAAAIVLGVVLNVCISQGWVVWPVIFVVSLITMVHEAASRNTQGVPPIQVYALFAGVLVVCLVWLMIMAAFGPWLLVIATPLLVWYAGKGILENRRRDKLIEQRRKDGQCVGCGEPIDGSFEVCPNCGLDCDPDGQRLQRVATMARSRANPVRGRDVIKGTAALTHAQRRAQALADRSASRPGRKRPS